MNTLVSFEISKLLFDKGFDEFCSNAIGLEYKDIVSIPFEYGVRETEYVKYGVLCNSRMDEFNSDYVSCPTIAEVVMWLYEKHGIWVTVYTMDKWLPNDNDKEQLFDYSLKQMKLGLIDISKKPEEFNSPTEAYSSAIEYTLKNLI